MLNTIIGVLAVALTILAYYQTDFGLTLYVNNGVSGALISFVNVAIYIIAIYTSKKTRQKLVYIVPFIAFLISFQSFESNLSGIGLSESMMKFLPYIPAIATFFVSLSALQHSITLNKIILFVGVVIWAVYSYILSAWYAMAADIVGLIVIIISLNKIYKKRVSKGQICQNDIK